MNLQNSISQSLRGIITATTLLSALASGTAVAARMDVQLSASPSSYADGASTNAGTLAHAATLESFPNTAPDDTATSGTLVFSNTANLATGDVSATGADASLAATDTVSTDALAVTTTVGTEIITSSDVTASSPVIFTASNAAPASAAIAQSFGAPPPGPSPEPASMVMIASGLAAIFTINRKRK